mmetsp:Transcript_30116/g.39983  ORF Transcript_30116/g.39983 Transcript_30116/m.39983 type:complete len:135 (-) Transcript_30116:79-483(-)
MLEVFRKHLVTTPMESKIEFTRILLVQMGDLPLHLINRLDSLQFDLYDKNVFYAVGSTNEAFEQIVNNAGAGAGMVDYEEMKVAAMTKSSERHGPQQFRIEKFFINCEDTFQSQTMCLLDLPTSSASAEDPFVD